MLPQNIITEIEQIIGKITIVKNTIPISGGCIHTAIKVITKEKTFFIKYSKQKNYPNMFKEEANGLALLAKNSSFDIPAVYKYSDNPDLSFIIMEFIESAKRNNDYWDNFGKNLAQMHQATINFYGLESNNYIGLLPQINTPNTSFIDFWITKRLDYQLKLAVNSEAISKEYIKKFEQFYYKLENLVPIEPPSFIHGDLWAGNFMTDTKGEAVIIDPAVYYGHRECDIAMSKLFGGFDKQFYIAYHSEMPMEKNWEQRIAIWNIYPLLVHVNLFGASYFSSIEQVLKKYV